MNPIKNLQEDYKARFLHLTLKWKLQIYTPFLGEEFVEMIFDLERN